MRFAGTVVESSAKAKFENRLASIGKAIRKESQYSICTLTDYLFLRITRDQYSVHCFCEEDTYKAKVVKLSAVVYHEDNSKFLIDLL